MPLRADWLSNHLPVNNVVLNPSDRHADIYIHTHACQSHAFIHSQLRSERTKEREIIHLQDSLRIRKTIMVRRDFLLVERVVAEVDEALDVREPDLRHDVVLGVVGELRVADPWQEGSRRGRVVRLTSKGERGFSLLSVRPDADCSTAKRERKRERKKLPWSIGLCRGGPGDLAPRGRGSRSCSGGILLRPCRAFGSRILSMPASSSVQLVWRLPLSGPVGDCAFECVCTRD